MKVIMKSPTLTLLTVVPACLIALFGCAPSDTDDSSGGSTLTGPIADLQGTWITSCYPDGDGNYVKESFKVEGSKVTTKDGYYSNSSCTDSLYDYDSISTNLTIGDSVTFVDGTKGYKFSMAVQSFKAVVSSQASADILNAASFCGLTNWKPNVSTELMGMTCNGSVISPKNTLILSMYNIIGNNLYLGEGNTDTYPTTVNTSLIYVKQ